MDVLMQQKQDIVKKINDIEGVINKLEKQTIDIERKSTTSMSVKRKKEHVAETANLKELLKDQKETKTLLREIELLTDAVITESKRNEDGNDNHEGEGVKTMDEWLESAKEALALSINDGSPADQEVINSKYELYMQDVDSCGTLDFSVEQTDESQEMPVNFDVLPGNEENVGNITTEVQGPTVIETLDEPIIQVNDPVVEQHVDQSTGTTTTTTTTSGSVCATGTKTTTTNTTASLVGQSISYSHVEDPHYVNTTKTKTTRYITRDAYSEYETKMANYSGLEPQEQAALIYNMLKPKNEMSVLNNPLEIKSQLNASQALAAKKQHETDSLTRDETFRTEATNMVVNELPSGVILAYPEGSPTNGAMRFDPIQNCWISVENCAQKKIDEANWQTKENEIIKTDIHNENSVTMMKQLSEQIRLECLQMLMKITECPDVVCKLIPKPVACGELIETENVLEKIRHVKEENVTNIVQTNTVEIDKEIQDTCQNTEIQTIRQVDLDIIEVQVPLPPQTIETIVEVPTTITNILEVPGPPVIVTDDSCLHGVIRPVIKVYHETTSIVRVESTIELKTCVVALIPGNRIRELDMIYKPVIGLEIFENTITQEIQDALEMTGLHSDPFKYEGDGLNPSEVRAPITLSDKEYEWHYELKEAADALIGHGMNYIYHFDVRPGYNVKPAGYLEAKGCKNYNDIRNNDIPYCDSGSIIMVLSNARTLDELELVGVPTNSLNTPSTEITILRKNPLNKKNGKFGKF
jgi:hypothetical protein